MYFIVAIVIFLLSYMLSHRNLKSFKHGVTKVVVILSLFILLTVILGFFIIYLISNNHLIEEMGKEAIFLFIFVPAYIMLVEIISVPVITYQINSYNIEKITRKKFLIRQMIIILLIYLISIWMWS